MINVHIKIFNKYLHSIDLKWIYVQNIITNKSNKKYNSELTLQKIKIN